MPEATEEELSLSLKDNLCSGGSSCALLRLSGGLIRARASSNAREERGGHGESVYLHLYDLNDTFAHMNSVGIDH